MSLALAGVFFTTSTTWEGLGHYRSRKRDYQLKCSKHLFSLHYHYDIFEKYYQVDCLWTWVYILISFSTDLVLSQKKCVTYHTLWGFPCGSAGKESTCKVGTLGLIPGLGRPSGEGKVYPLQYSGLENSMDCIVHGVAKNQTQLNDFHYLQLLSCL